MNHKTQEQRILWLLQASWPNWTPAPELARISLQYSARVFSLRRKGWQITNRVKIFNGVRHGEFRLGPPPTPRSVELRPPSATTSKKQPDNTLFDLGVAHRDDN